MSGEPAKKASPPPVFLERQSYRQRRLRDFARLLPLAGAGLFLIPLLWPVAGDPAVQAGRAAPVPLSAAIGYIFLVWAGLIALAGLLGRSSRRWPDEGRAASQEKG